MVGDRQRHRPGPAVPLADARSVRTRDGAYELVPDLATDLGTPNEDFTEWTFTLKDGIKWETGDPVTAEEVAFGIKRSFDGDTFATGPGTSYSKPYFDGGDDYNGPYADGEDFPGVTVEGNDIIMKFSTPFAEMDYYSIFPAIGPVPLDADGRRLRPRRRCRPVPTRSRSSRPNQELVLVTNDQWDPATDPARRQLVDKYTFKFDVQPDGCGRDRAQRPGQHDGRDRDAVHGLQQGERRKASRTRSSSARSPAPASSMPNFEKVPEVEVRQALAYAYDYENIWSAAGEVVGRHPGQRCDRPERSASVCCPRAWPAARPGTAPMARPSRSTPRSRRSCSQRPATSRASTRSRSSTTRRRPRARRPRSSASVGYEESGFKVKKYPYSGGSLYDVWTNPDNALYKKINLLGTAWCQDWPSAATFLPVIVGDRSSAYNTGKFSVPEVDDEIERIKNLPIEEQADAWGELEQMVMTDYQPVINTGYYQNIFGFGTDIGGFANDTSVGGAPDYRTIYVK